MNPTEMTNNADKTYKCVAVNSKTNGRNAFYCSTRAKALSEAVTYLKTNKLTKLYTITDPVQVFDKNSRSTELY